MNARDVVTDKQGWASVTLPQIQRAIMGWDEQGEAPAVVILGDGTLKRLELIRCECASCDEREMAGLPREPVDGFRLVDPEDQ